MILNLNGKSYFKENDKLTEYTNGCKNGDVIDCVLNYSQNTISYYFNGEDKGVAFQDEKILGSELYPTVWLDEGCGSSITFDQSSE